MRILIAAVALIILGVTGVRAQSTDKQALADEIHAYFIGQFRDYALISRTKVLVLCVDWDSESPFKNAFATYTDAGSDGEIFSPRLRRDALRRCKGWAARENAGCDCQVLDEDGKNRLKIP